jgi:hypothetical protein
MLSACLSNFHSFLNTNKVLDDITLKHAGVPACFRLF